MALSVDQLLAKAKSFARKGQVGDAEQAYRSVLERFPKNKRANDGLNALKQTSSSTRANELPKAQYSALVNLYNRRQFSQLVQHATSMILAYSNSIPLYEILAAAHAGLGNFDQSIVCYEKILNINPDSVDAHYNLGTASQAMGQLDDAITSFQRALQIKPDHIDAYINLGNSLHACGRLDDAIQSFETALKYNPKLAVAYNNLGTALKQKGQFDLASAQYKKALGIQPGFFDALNNLGNIQIVQGYLEDAIASFDRAIQNKPDQAEAHLNLGNALKAHGDLDKAIESFENALRIKPNFPEAYRCYVSMKKFSAKDECTDQISELLNSNDITENDEMHLSFAMSKIKTDLGHVTESFEYLQTGNALRKKELAYDFSNDAKLFQDIQNVFATKDTKTAHITIENNLKTKPIFILGMPRSGTSLVEQIISSHSSVFGAGELAFLSQAMHKFNWLENDLSTAMIQNIRAEYFRQIETLNVKQGFVTDKMPSNFMWIGFIAKAFPEAKIIHIKRKPAAVCWSNYKIYFPSASMGYSFDMEDTAQYFGLYQTLMKFWHAKFPGRIYDLNYEQLTENQLEETQKLLAHLELDWEDAVLDFHKSDRSVVTASNLQVRNKMYQGSSQEWQKYENHLAPMLKILDKLAATTKST